VRSSNLLLAELDFEYRGLCGDCCLLYTIGFGGRGWTGTPGVTLDLRVWLTLKFGYRKLIRIL